MIKLSNIISEGRSTIISSESAVELFNSNNPSGLAKTQIYRGIHTYTDNVPRYIKPSLHKRKSTYTSDGLNYYTMLIDNLDSWKHYPKRSNSVICTTDINRASEYSDSESLIAGIIFNIIPKDGAKIAICPSRDIWYSFKFMNDFERPDYQLDTFNQLLHMIVMQYAGIHGKSKKWANDNYDNLVKVFNYVSDNKDKFEFQDFRDNFLLNSCYEHGYNNLLEYFNEYALNPDKNGFTIKEYNNKFRIDDNVEIWTDSECIMIPEMQFKSFKSNIKT